MLGSFLKVKVQNGGYFLELLKFQVFLGSLKFLIFLGSERYILGPSLRMEKKWEYPTPLGSLSGVQENRLPENSLHPKRNSTGPGLYLSNWEAIKYHISYRSFSLRYRA